MSLLIDDETETYWDHVTGKALHGPLEGHQLEAWPIDVTTVAEALKSDPDLRISISRPRLFGRVVARLCGRRLLLGRGFLPPGFKKTMGELDDRLPALTHGLAVVDGSRAKFYPTRLLEAPVHEDWNGRPLHISIGADGLPAAAWESGERPLQVFMRWYGFTYSWPDSELFDEAESRAAQV